MLLQRDKKNKTIYIYFLLFILITSINNKNLELKKIFNNKLIFEVKGMSNNDNSKLKNNLENINNENIFKLNKNKILDEINSNNLVSNYLVKKKYPDKIVITINKAAFIGKVFRNNKLFIIGSNGKFIDIKKNYNPELPYFYGNFNKNEFLRLLNILKLVELKIDNIKSFYYFPSGRWDIKFNNGLLFKLPIGKTKDALIRALALKENKNFINSKVIDLRINNKIISND